MEKVLPRKRAAHVWSPMMCLHSPQRVAHGGGCRAMVAATVCGSPALCAVVVVSCPSRK